MHRLLQLLTVCLFITLFFAASATAEDLTAAQIIDKMESGFQNENMLMQFKMTIHSKSGQARERKLRARMKKENNLSRSVISFEEPADVRAVKFLVIENKDRDDDQMLYLSSIKRVRRIASSQRSGSFMGTDFSYNDLTSHDPDEGKHERLADETLDGKDCYVVESIPNDPEDYGYGKAVWWVQKGNLVAQKADLYDKSLKLQKEMSASNLDEYKPGKWLAKKIIMKNVQKGTWTQIDILKHKSDADIGDDYFTERFLKDESKL
jgi:Outer membrane lipoprotein-sorting protein